MPTKTVQGALEYADTCMAGSAIQILAAEVRRLHAEINSPEILDFVKAVNLEAAHQRERWGVEHDAGKSDLDWNWTLAYLVNKSLASFRDAEMVRKWRTEFGGSGPDFQDLLLANEKVAYEKGLHHLITSAALLANWHSARVGGVGKVMRPGAEAPKGEVG